MLTFESINRAAMIAAQSEPVIAKLQAINSKAKIPGIAIRDQLGAQDLDQFSRLSQQIAASMLAQLIESHRDRDLRVLAQFIRLADQEYRWQKVPNEGEADYLPYIVLAVMREQLPDMKVVEPDSTRCSMEYALHQIEAPILDALNQIKGIPEAVAFLNGVVKKYNQQQLDVTKMSKGDADAVRRYQILMAPAWRHRTFIHDVERIKLMSRAADLNNKSKAQDLTFAGGDIKQIGATLDHMMKQNEIEPDMQTALKLWFVVNEKIPAEILKSFDAMAKTK
jgi:hypothetical protein